MTYELNRFAVQVGSQKEKIMLEPYYYSFNESSFLDETELSLEDAVLISNLLQKITPFLVQMGFFRYLKKILFIIILLKIFPGVAMALDKPNFSSQPELFIKEEISSEDSLIGTTRESRIAKYKKYLSKMSFTQIFNKDLPKHRRVIEGLKLSCLFALATVQIAVDYTPIGSPIHKFLSATCAVGWTAYNSLIWWSGGGEKKNVE